MVNFAIENNWYKGNIAQHLITDIDIVSEYSVTGKENESWDGSLDQDRSVMCYRIGTKVIIVCSTITSIQNKMFLKFLSLERVTGLGSVTIVGEFAFCYTPNITSIDLVPSNFTSIGQSAFRLSGVEDCIDLTVIQNDNIGTLATRSKRWSDAALSAIRNITFPRSVYLKVPNADNQFNYPDIVYGTASDGTVYYAEYGCVTFACYHIWNHFYAGTQKQYNNWLDWFNATLNSDGMFAENNDMTTATESKAITALGWTDHGKTYVNDSSALQTIIDRLMLGYPTYAVIRSTSVAGKTHALTIVGCDAETHKLAVVDSSATNAGNKGYVSWVYFEDLFTDESVYDSIRVVDYNIPRFAPGDTWFSPNVSSITRSAITEITIEDMYTPTGTITDSWDASVDGDGSLTAYVEGTKMTISGNGSGIILINSDSTYMFSDHNKTDYFTALTSLNGLSLLNTSSAFDMSGMFRDTRALLSLDIGSFDTTNVGNMTAMFAATDSMGGMKFETLDVANWDVSSCTNMTGTFQNCNYITELDVSRWNTRKLTSTYLTFNNCHSLPRLDLSGWNVSHVTTFAGMFQACKSLETIGDVSDWDVSSVTSMQTMFNNCNALITVDVSHWETGSVTNMQSVFKECNALSDINVSNWDVSSATTMKDMFANCDNLKSLDFSKWNNSSVKTTQNMLYNMDRLEKLSIGSQFKYCTSTTPINVSVPTPSAEYIEGADGNWRDVLGNVYAPSSIVSNVARTYYASNSAMEEDCNKMVLVKNGTLLKIAETLRSKTGKTTGLMPSQFVDEINTLS